MDGVDDHWGYAAMGPLTEPARDEQAPAEPAPDYLLRVSDPAAARAALDTADRMVVIDGRATAWLVLGRLAHIGAFLVLFAGMDQLHSVRTVVVFAAFVALLLLSSALQRASGVNPQLHSLRALLIGSFVILGSTVAAIALDLPNSWLPALLAVWALAFSVGPVVQWARSRRRGAQLAWPRGAEAFAILSLLDSVVSIAPGRLCAVVGLEPAVGAAWLERLRSEHAVFDVRPHGRFLRAPWVAPTPVIGRGRLARMRHDLDGLAAQAPSTHTVRSRVPGSRHGG